MYFLGRSISFFNHEYLWSLVLAVELKSQILFYAPEL